MWDGFVELLRATIISVAQACGGSLGGGILLVSAGIRLAMLPLTLRMARRAREQQVRIAALKPEIEALQRRYASDPKRLVQEMRAVYSANDIKLVTPSGLITVAVQLPLLSGLFAAVRTGLGSKVRFLWVADLAKPEGLLALVVTALTAWGVSGTPTPPGSSSVVTPLIAVTVVGTLVFLWTASSAVALSVGAGSLVSVFQNRLIARDSRTRSAANPGA